MNSCKIGRLICCLLPRDVCTLAGKKLCLNNSLLPLSPVASYPIVNLISWFRKVGVLSDCENQL